MSMQYIVKTLHFFWNNLDIHIHVNLQQKKKICLGNEIIRWEIDKKISTTILFVSWIYSKAKASSLLA